MTPKNMVFSRSNSVLLVIHNNINPSAAEWSAMCEDIRQFGAAMRGVLVYTEGGSPNAIQRKQLRDVLNPDTQEVVPMVILTTSMVARVAVTAFNLFFKNKLKAIEPTNYEEGYQYLQVPRENWDTLIQAHDNLAKTIRLKIPYQTNVSSRA